MHDRRIADNCRFISEKALHMCMHVYWPKRLDEQYYFLFLMKKQFTKVWSKVLYNRSIGKSKLKKRHEQKCY